MSRKSRRLKAFIRSRSGNFTVTFALTAVALMGAAGSALDYSRIYLSRNGMATALDSAVMAVAAELNEHDMTQDEIAEYLNAFVSSNMDPGNPVVDDYKVTDIKIDYTTQQVSARIAADVPMTLLGVLGWKVMPVSLSSATQFGTNLSEVAMTFDVTGSMAGSKLASLKKAAKEGIDILLDVNTPTRKRLRVSMVPYAESVNAGPLKPYVFAEPAGFTGPNPAYGDSYAIAADGCSTERKGDYQFTDAGPEMSAVNRDPRLTKCPGISVQGLTADDVLLNSAVDKLSASGTTAGHIGIQWAWYTISPQWAPYFPDESKPGPYGNQLRKYAIIMTDGEFNTAYAGVDPKQSVSRQTTKSMNYALSLCTKMKQAGIEIFAVGFDLKQKSAIDTMKNCASPAQGGVQYFYSAKTGDELVEAYRLIAQRIKTVRLLN
ncbi:MAG: pilus assembly protein [Nitratireductor sp.]|nr:pilus assembly protein [Nitratireductor sp.]